MIKLPLLLLRKLRVQATFCVNLKWLETLSLHWIPLLLVNILFIYLSEAILYLLPCSCVYLLILREKLSVAQQFFVVLFTR